LILGFIEGNFDITLQSNEIFAEGIAELDVVYNGILTFLKGLDINRVEVIKDFSIVRGLDYYTGIVFETFIEGSENLGSICSGGRYNNLTGYIEPKKNYFNGVGGSIGVNRLFDWLLDNIVLAEYEDKYLFLNFGF
jgi:histidyl-tRNA synthetase